MNTLTQPSIGRQIHSSALEAGHLIEAQACRLLSLLVTNTGPDQYIQVHDALEAPANGSVPLFVFPIGTGQVGSLDTPVRLLNGLYICNSTTAATKTAGADDCWFLTRNN